MSSPVKQKPYFLVGDDLILNGHFHQPGHDNQNPVSGTCHQQEAWNGGEPLSNVASTSPEESTHESFSSSDIEVFEQEDWQIFPVAVPDAVFPRTEREDADDDDKTSVCQIE